MVPAEAAAVPTSASKSVPSGNISVTKLAPVVALRDLRTAGRIEADTKEVVAIRTGLEAL